MTEGEIGATAGGIPAPPKKRSLFSKKAVANVAAVSDSVAFFSRAADLFENNVEEERRRRERKALKIERKRSSTSAELKQSRPPFDKKRKVSGLDKGGEGYSSDGSGHEESSRARRASSQTTPGSRKSPRNAKPSIPLGSPTSLSARYKRDLDAQKSNSSKGYISLSDNDSDDDDDEGLAQVTERNTHTIMLYDDDEPVKPAPRKLTLPPPPTSEDDDMDLSEEEFPELVKAAEERKQQQAEAKAKASKAKLEKHQNSNGATAAEDDLFDLESTDNMDPTIEVFITSKIECMKPLLVRRKLTQRLKEVRFAWCDKQDVQIDDLGKPLRDVIFLSWRGKRLYDSTNCKALGLNLDSSGNLLGGDGVDSNGKLHFEAWTQETFEYNEQRKAAKEAREREGSDEAEVRKERKVESGPKHKVVMKAKDLEPFKLVVKPHTSVEKLIIAFRKSRDVPEDRNIQLYFEGGRLDPESTIAETEIGEDPEETDTVEVHFK